MSTSEKNILQGNINILNSEIKRAKNARAEKDDEISELKMQENRLKLVLQNQDKEWKAKYQALEQQYQDLQHSKKKLAEEHEQLFIEHQSNI